MTRIRRDRSSPHYNQFQRYTTKEHRNSILKLRCKSKSRDKVGFKAFDLLSYDKVRNTAWILELKVSDNENDSLLHSVLEAYTYLNTVHREKLLDDYSLNTSAELKAAVLSIEGDRRHREYKALDSMPFLKQLISRLMIEVFFLSGEPAF